MAPFKVPRLVLCVASGSTEKPGLFSYAVLGGSRTPSITTIAINESAFVGKALVFVVSKI